MQRATFLTVLSVLALGCAADVGEAASEDLRADVEAVTLGEIASPGIAIVRPRDRTPRGCDRARQIGALSRGFACPAPGAGWSGRPLFGTPTPRDRRDVVVSPWGAGFCLYEYVGERGFSYSGLPNDRSGTSDDVSPGRTPSEWLEADCPVVAALGPAEDTAVALAGEYESAYRAQMGALASYPAASAAVEIALIDTSPDSGLTTIEPTWDPDLPHGRAVGMAMRAVALPDTNAGARIPYFHSWQAVHGSRRGYIGDLAQVIERAVRGRRTDVGARLILNVSLGFHPEFGTVPTSDDVTNYRAHALAVLSALNYASCRGAINIVAAGNTESGPSPDARPMYPAAFAESTAWTCNTAATPRVGVPVLYAASGVDAFDRDLPNARAGARAPLVAPAYAVTVRDADAGPLPVMTGSSFAAAGVSAVAALVWAHHSSATPQQVMQIVHDSGVVLPSYATFCSGGYLSCGHVRRVHACLAVSAALAARCSAGVPSACTARAAMPACEPYPSAALSVSSEDGLSRATTLDVRLEPAGVGTGTCSGDWYAPPDVAPEPQSMCPDAFLENGMHLEIAGPQPGSDPCEVCAVAGSSTGASLVIGLSPTWSGTLSSGALQLGGTHYALSPTTLTSSSGTLAAVPLPAGTAVSPTTSAALTFKTTAGASVVVPLSIWGS